MNEGNVNIRVRFCIKFCEKVKRNPARIPSTRSTLTSARSGSVLIRFVTFQNFNSEPTWRFGSAGNRETAVGGGLCCHEKLHFKLRLKNEKEKKEGWTFPDLEEGASEANVFDCCLHHVDNDHFEHNQSKAKYDHNTSAANQ